MTNGSFRLTDPSGRVIADNLSREQSQLADSAANGVVPTASGRIRVGTVVSEVGSVFFASSDPDIVASSKVFRTTANAILASASYIEKAVAAVEDRSRVNSRRLIHNLTSLNGHMIQDLYSVVSQDRLAGNIRRSVPIIAEEMRGKKVYEFAKCFLSLAKHSAAMKAEFSVFKKVAVGGSAVEKNWHYAHKVAMNAAYLFFTDFADSGCFVNVSNSHIRTHVDYEFTFVAFYHLFDNAAKYIRPGTNLEVSFSQEVEGVLVTFEMCSLAIEPDEVTKVLDEGYSGEAARRLGLHGDGVGMSLVQKVMNMHGGRLDVIPRWDTRFSKDGADYQKNRFNLYFPN